MKWLDLKTDNALAPDADYTLEIDHEASKYCRRCGSLMQFVGSGVVTVEGRKMVVDDYLCRKCDLEPDEPELQEAA